MMTIAPPLVIFSNAENTDPTYSKFGSSHQQKSEKEQRREQASVTGNNHRPLPIACNHRYVMFDVSAV